MAVFRPIKQNNVEYGGNTSFTPIKVYTFSSTLQSWTLTTTLDTSKTITGTATSGGLIKVTTSTNHGYSTNDWVYIAGAGTANGYWKITVVDVTNFTLNGSVWEQDETGGTSQKVTAGQAPQYEDSTGASTLLINGTGTGTPSNYYFTGPDNLGLDSTKYNYVRVRVRRTVAGSIDISSSWLGQLDYKLAEPTTWSDTYSTPGSMTIEDPGILTNLNTWYTLEYNLATSPNYGTIEYWGGIDTTAEIVNNIRLKFISIVHDSQFEIDWIQIGSKGQSTATSNYLANTLANSTGTGIQGDQVFSPVSKQIFLKTNTETDALTEIGNISQITSKSTDPLLISGSSATTGNIFNSHQDFSSASWTKSGGGTPYIALTGGQTGPYGTSDAFYAAVTAAGTGTLARGIYRTSGTGNILVGETVTFSVYLKAGEITYVQLNQAAGQYGKTNLAVFDLSTGMVKSGKGTIEDVGNGWYRCSITSTATSTTGANHIIYAHNGTTATFASTEGNKFYLWGPGLYRQGFNQGNRSSLWDQTGAEGVPLKYWDGRAWVNLSSIDDKLSQTRTSLQSLVSDLALSGSIIRGNNGVGFAPPGVGATNAVLQAQSQTNTFAAAGIMLAHWSTGTNVCGGIYTAKSRSGTVGQYGTNSIIQDGALGTWKIAGDTGTGFLECASIDIDADGTFSGAATPTVIRFRVTPQASTTPDVGFSIRSNYVNLPSGSTYSINTVSVLSSTTLGSSVVNSSLTSVGTLNGLTIASGNALNFSTAATITAGTSNQGQSPLTNDYNVITTAGSSPSGVTLPTATVGRSIVIVNKGANTVNVFPATGAQIDALGANVSIALAVGKVLRLNASSTTQWYSNSNDIGVSTGISDGDKGDITVSGSGATWTIDNTAVTYTKIQNISTTSRLLGRNTAGAGVTEEVTISQALDWLGATQGQLTYRGASNWTALTIGGNNTVLKSNGTVPTWGSVAGTELTGTTLASGIVTSSLTSVGTINSGIWNGSAILGQYGGTGVANTGKTITLGGSLVTSGAFDTTLNMTGTTNLTLPTTGTLATVAGTLSSSTSSTQAGYFGDIYLYDDSTPSHYLQITNSGNLTLARTLSLNVNDANRTVSLSGDLTLANNFTTSGSFATTLTVTGITNVTLPTTGTLATLAGSEAFTNKTYNGLTVTSTTGTLTITAAKTLSVSNTLTLTGTDGSSVAFGAGGTVLYNGGALGTPTSGTLTNCTGLPLTGLASVMGPCVLGKSGAGSGAVTAIFGGTANGVFRLDGTASNASFGAIDLTSSNAVTGVLPAGNGGTGSAFTAFTGPDTSVKTFALPNSSGTIAVLGAAQTFSAKQIIDITDAVTNDVTHAFRVTHQTSGTPATNIGVGIEFAAETAAGNVEVGALIEAITTNVGTGTEAFDLSFKLMNTGLNAAQAFRISPTRVTIPLGSTYQINGVDILSNTTLGSSVVSSSLTSVGSLTNLTIASAGTLTMPANGFVVLPTNTSATAPGVYFSGDSNTGFYQAAADKISITAAGNTLGHFVYDSVNTVGGFLLGGGTSTLQYVDGSGGWPRFQAHSNSNTFSAGAAAWINWNAGAVGTGLVFAKSRSSTIGTYSTTNSMANGDALGTLRYFGDHVVAGVGGFKHLAGISVQAGEAWSDTTAGTKVLFQTTSTGSIAAPTTKLQISVNGHVSVTNRLTVGTLTDQTAINFYVANNITGGANSYGIWQDGQTQTDATTNSIGIGSVTNVVGSHPGLTNLYAFRASQNNLNNPSALASNVVQQVGFGALSTMLDARTNSAFQGLLAANSKTIVSTAGAGLSRSANVTTVTTTTAHTLKVGSRVAIYAADDPTFDTSGVTVATVPTSTTFTYANTGSNTTSQNGTVYDLSDLNIDMSGSAPNLINGIVTVGPALPYMDVIQVVQTPGSSAVVPIVQAFGTGFYATQNSTAASFGSNLILSRGSTTTIGDMTALPSGWNIGHIRWAAPDGRKQVAAAGIYARTTALTTAMNSGGGGATVDLIFEVGNNALPVERMRLTSAGVLTIPAGGSISIEGVAINTTTKANTAWLGSGTANSTTYLRGDGTWQTVAGTGDVVGDDVSTTAQNIVAYSGTGGKNITELTGTQGDVLYHNGTNWAKLAAGTAGKLLKTGGAGANPSWAYPEIYVGTLGDTAINSVTDVTIFTQDVTSAANDQFIVEVWGTILNNSTLARTYVITLDFDGIFDVEITTGSMGNSATIEHPFIIKGVCAIRSSSLAYAMMSIDGQIAASTLASGTDTTMAATHLQGKGWGTTTSDLTGTLTVALKIRSADATATQTFRLHYASIRKIGA